MNKMKKYIALFVCALTAVALATVSLTSAYFTARTQADGGHDVVAKDVITIPEEDVKGLTKTITIKNVGEADCWVRVKLFYSSDLDIKYEAAEGWTLKDDGYWYYDEIVPKGATLDKAPLKASIEGVDEKVAADKFFDEFNVVVITESTPVLFDKSGEAYADWSLAANEWTHEVKEWW